MKKYIWDTDEIVQDNTPSGRLQEVLKEAVKVQNLLKIIGDLSEEEQANILPPLNEFIKAMKTAYLARLEQDYE